MSIDYKQALARAARYCSTAERCSKDVRDKLILWGLNEENSDRALAELVKEKFIDDERYASYFVKDKLKFNKWGRRKIYYALRNKQIPDSTISEALEQINEDDYLAMLDKLLFEKARSAGSVKSASGKAKLFRFASQRGFTSEEIYAAIERLQQPE
jgi:regulatory protein